MERRDRQGAVSGAAGHRPHSQGEREMVQPRVSQTRECVWAEPIKVQSLVQGLRACISKQLPGGAAVASDCTLIEKL